MSSVYRGLLPMPLPHLHLESNRPRVYQESGIMLCGVPVGSRVLSEGMTLLSSFNGTGLWYILRRYSGPRPSRKGSGDAISRGSLTTSLAPTFFGSGTTWEKPRSHSSLSRCGIPTLTTHCRIALRQQVQVVPSARVVTPGHSCRAATSTSKGPGCSAPCAIYRAARRAKPL